MTLFNSELVDTELEERIKLGNTLFGEENIIVQLELIDAVMHGVYKYLNENKQSTENIDKLIKYAPPLINDSLRTSEIKNLETDVVKLYNKFLNVKINDDTVEKPKNYQLYKNHIYETGHLLYEKHIRPESSLQSKIERTKRDYEGDFYDVPVYTFMFLHEEYDSIVDTGVKSFNDFMVVYYMHYFDLYMKTFQQSLVELYSNLSKMSFIEKDTENSFPIESISNSKILDSSLGDFLKYIYYEKIKEGNKLLENNKFSNIALTYGESNTEENKIDSKLIYQVALDNYDSMDNKNDIMTRVERSSMREDIIHYALKIPMDMRNNIMRVYNLEELSDIDYLPVKTINRLRDNLWVKTKELEEKKEDERVNQLTVYREEIKNHLDNLEEE